MKKLWFVAIIAMVILVVIVASRVNNTYRQENISRGVGNQTLPIPFKKAVDEIVRQALIAERNRNIQVYATNGTIFASADTVTGIQSNQIVELLVKTGLQE